MTHVADGRHFTASWKSHPGPYAMCCVRIPVTALDPEIIGIRESLAQFPFVQLHPEHFLHIPVQELGFLETDGNSTTTLSQHRLDEFIAMAERPLLDFPRFPVVLGPVNSFADSAFLDVHDGGWISRVRGRMLDFVPFKATPRFPYVPHVTLAYYTEREPIGTLPAALAEWRDIEIGGFIVETVDIVTIDTREEFPQLTVAHSFPLGTTRATGTLPLFPTLSQD